MGSDQIANLQRSGYLLLCFIPYMILSLYPFVQNLRYSWRTSAGICALCAAAETAAAFILTKGADMDMTALVKALIVCLLAGGAGAFATPE